MKLHIVQGQLYLNIQASDLKYPGFFFFFFKDVSHALLRELRFHPTQSPAKLSIIQTAGNKKGGQGLPVSLTQREQPRVLYLLSRKLQLLSPRKKPTCLYGCQGLPAEFIHSAPQVFTFTDTSHLDFFYFHTQPGIHIAAILGPPRLCRCQTLGLTPAADPYHHAHAQGWPHRLCA